jgi:hypothetical protein
MKRRLGLLLRNAENSRSACTLRGSAGSSSFAAVVAAFTFRAACPTPVAAVA